MFKQVLTLIILFFHSHVMNAQLAWPSESWSNAVNLTPVMDAGGLVDISGLFWNGNQNRLFVSNGAGGLRVLQYNSGTNSFSQIANRTFTGGPEGITQVNLNANEIYSIDEDSYQIRKYTYPANISSLTLANSWNILASPSPMPNTGNTGPEGIAFVPDSFLSAAGFVSQATGALYTSVKGMGGLMFIAHQNQGYIWVYDVNPNVNNNFAYVGKYKTSRTESCEVTFDRSTGLLYILHNINSNYIEVTNLSSTALSGGERKFVTNYEYYVGNPSGNQNIEGFAITSKCNDSTNVSAWLCRDVESSESSSYKQNCVRWFNPFTAPGTCGSPVTVNLRIFIQGFYRSNGLMKPVANETTYPNLCDTVTLEIRQSTGAHAFLYSVKGVVDVNGYGNFTFPSSFSGGSYYLVVKHRSTIEVWSASPVQFNSTVVSYSFTDAASKAYGNNLLNVGQGNYAIYIGDINQDGIISSSDLASVETKSRTFNSGYLREDLTGDFFVESSDHSLIENNSRLNLSTQKP